MSKKKLRTRLLSMMLTLVMLVGAVPVTVSADTETSTGIEDGKLYLEKTATLNPDGTYNFELAAFATGQEVTSTVTVEQPLDIVLVIDQSGSMAGTRLAQLKEAVTEFVGLVAAHGRTNAIEHKISFVGFGSQGDEPGNESSGDLSTYPVAGGSTGAWVNTGIFLNDGTFRNYLTYVGSGYYPVNTDDATPENKVINPANNLELWDEHTYYVQTTGMTGTRYHQIYFKYNDVYYDDEQTVTVNEYINNISEHENTNLKSLLGNVSLDTDKTYYFEDADGMIVILKYADAADNKTVYERVADPNANYSNYYMIHNQEFVVADENASSYYDKNESYTGWYVTLSLGQTAAGHDVFVNLNPYYDKNYILKTREVNENGQPVGYYLNRQNRETQLGANQTLYVNHDEIPNIHLNGTIVDGEWHKEKNYYEDAWMSLSTQKNGQGDVNPVIYTIIDKFGANGATRIGYGMEMAAMMLYHSQNDSSRKPVVLVFTDGEPGFNGFNATNYSETAYEEAHWAMKYADRIKRGVDNPAWSWEGFGVNTDSYPHAEGFLHKDVTDIQWPENWPRIAELYHTYLVEQGKMYYINEDTKEIYPVGDPESFTGIGYDEEWMTYTNQAEIDKFIAYCTSNGVEFPREYPGKYDCTYYIMGGFLGDVIQQLMKLDITMIDDDNYLDEDDFNRIFSDDADTSDFSEEELEFIADIKHQVLSFVWQWELMSALQYHYTGNLDFLNKDEAQIFTVAFDTDNNSSSDAYRFLKALSSDWIIDETALSARYTDTEIDGVETSHERNVSDLPATLNGWFNTVDTDNDNIDENIPKLDDGTFENHEPITATTGFYHHYDPNNNSAELDLTGIFETIEKDITTITSPTISLSDEHIFREILSEYLTLNLNHANETLGLSVEVVSGTRDGATIEWDNNHNIPLKSDGESDNVPTFELGNTNPVPAVIGANFAVNVYNTGENHTGGSGSNVFYPQTIDIEGVLYQNMFFGHDLGKPNSGYKLVLKIDGVILKDPAVVGQVIDTNNEESGIWRPATAEGGRKLEASFPVPTTIVSYRDYVIDYAKPIYMPLERTTVETTENVITKALHVQLCKHEGYTQVQPDDYVKTISGDYGTLNIETDGTLKYTPTTTSWNGYDVFHVLCVTNESFVTRQSANRESSDANADATAFNDVANDATGFGYVWNKIVVMPANNVYYEEDFTGVDGIAYSYVGSKEQSSAIWEENPQTTPDYADNNIRDTYRMDDGTKYIHGQEPVLMDDTGASAGQVKWARIGAGAKATFDFAGTGVDIYATTTSETAVIINLFSKLETYQFTLNKNAKPVLQQVVRMDTKSDSGVYDGIPVVTFEDLPYGEYRVEMIVAEGENDNGGAARTEFYLDGIRVYNPLGLYEPAGDEYYWDVVNKSDAEKAAKEALLKPIQQAYGETEMYSRFVEVRDRLIDKGNLNTTDDTNFLFIDRYTDKNDTEEDTTDDTFVDATKTAVIKDFETYGPKNEVYLDDGQMIAFKVNPAPGYYYYVGLKSPTGTSVTVDINGEETTLSHTTDIYYPVYPMDDGMVSILCKDDTVDTDDGTSTDKSELRVSITKLKICSDSLDDVQGETPFPADTTSQFLAFAARRYEAIDVEQENDIPEQIPEEEKDPADLIEPWLDEFDPFMSYVDDIREEISKKVQEYLSSVFTGIFSAIKGYFNTLK